MAARESPGVKSIIFLLALFAVLVVSGCTTTDGGGISYGKGVIITGFESDLGSLAVETDDDVSLLLRVQNQGEVDATNAEAILIGVDLNEWNAAFGYTERQPLNTLMSADPVTETEGQTKTAQWDLKAPKLPKGTEFTYEPVVRVFYDYQTKAAKPVTLVDVDELRRIIQQGKTLSGEATQSSAGPITVQIKTGNFIKTQNYDDPFPLNIFITNDLWESGGSVIEGSSTGGFYYGEKQYPVRVKITLPEGMRLESSSSTGCSTSGDWINLWKGKSAELTCEVRIDQPPDFKVEKLIQVELEYRYFVDASTTIKVIGTDEDWRF
jgi:hypothetical protein